MIHTDVKVGTDPYGKPAMEFTHSGGAEAIADALRGMLREDFSQQLDTSLSVTNEIVPKERFRYFIKVPELAAFYAEITDYRTAKDIGLS